MDSCIMEFWREPKSSLASSERRGREDHVQTMVKRKPRRMTEGFNLGHVRTVYGICPECEQNSVLVSVIEDYYKCTICGEDTRQYVNGSIKYLRITENDKSWLKNQK